MSRIYDYWEKLVGAVLRREKDRQLALCESFRTSSSVDFSSRFSFDSSVEDVGVDYFSSSFSFNPFAADVLVPAGVDEQIDEEFSRNWDNAFRPLNDMKPVSRSSGPRVDPADPSCQHILFFRNVMAIEYEEIRKATNMFGPNKLLGVGAFGPVYKGWIHEHTLSAVKPGSGLAVAVKKSNLEELQAHKEWSDFNPKLSDLGVARDVPTRPDTHISPRVMGTYGYVAPEYIATGLLTTRCDVYGFGVVLLELLSGLRVMDRMRPKEKHDLMKWAVPYLKDKRKLPRIIDSRLEGEYPREEAHTVGKLALRFVSLDLRLRPKMSEVVAVLETMH